jgi:SAM-dependent methyltransferase
MSKEPINIDQVSLTISTVSKMPNSVFDWAKRFAANLKAIVYLLRDYPTPVMHCPCCGERGKFALFGIPPRLNALCIRCYSLERHRFLRLFLQGNEDLVRGKDVLHFAPEKCLRAYLRNCAKTYVSTDLHPGAEDLYQNIESLTFADQTFDLVICCNVLTCVDDRKALLEMHRVLRRNGVILVTAPVIEGWDKTFEPSHVHYGEESYQLFGTPDQLRLYGRDIRNRIEATGFKLTETTANEPEARKHGLQRGGKIFIGRK